MNTQVVELYEKYKEWVSSNPIAASDLEATVKWISIYLAARFKNTKVITELVYSLSNLLVLFNDRILTNSFKTSHESSTSTDKIKLWLTILEYVEVFIEVTAREAWTERGKWGVAAFIQMIKCIGRLVLVVKCREHIVQIPPVPPLRRREMMMQQVNSQSNKVGFRLPASGRIVRSIDGVDPKGMRSWKPPSVCEVYPNGTAPDARLSRNQTIAEIVYILKPLVHLCAVMKCGPKTWRPYLVSLILDLFSLQLFRDSRNRQPLSTKQKSELNRRQIAMLLYIIRSPVYERYSGRRIDSVLHGLSSTLPLVGLILRPLAEYLPTWQDTYFYMWST